jgi:16S rRNA (guanine(966)-N(2))-methyltransferase RsmD
MWKIFFTSTHIQFMTKIFVMRISGGSACGIALQCPKDNCIRPATGAMREAVFSILGETVVGAHFADIFAGIGSYGLEAISRGANSGIFIENCNDNVVFLKKNISAVSKSAVVDASAFRVCFADAFKYPVQQTNLTFFDPPYGFFSECKSELCALLEKWILPKTIGILEMPSQTQFKLPEAVKVIKTLGNQSRKNSPVVLFLHKNSNEVGI